MDERIGLKGVLEGVSGMLDHKGEDDAKLLKTKMDCAKSIIDGVIKELTPQPKPVSTIDPPPPDPAVISAKDELKT